MTHNNKGFSLLELLITVLIIVLATALGLPSFHAFVADNKVVSYTNEVVRTLNMARSEAVKRGTHVSICKSAQSSPACDNTRNWKQGWITFVDTNNNQTVDNGEDVIASHGSMTSDYKFSQDGSFENFVTYEPNGNSNTSGTLYICSDQTQAKVRSVQIGVTGRIRSSNTDNYNNVCT